MVQPSLASLLVLLPMMLTDNQPNAVIENLDRPGWKSIFRNVGELPHEAHDRFSGGQKLDVSVGFYYECWPKFGPPLWTTNGHFVIYQTTQEQSAESIDTTYTYWPLDDNQWMEVLGDKPENRYSVPWQYRFPAGSSILLAGTLFVIWKFRGQLKRRPKRKLRGDTTHFDAAVEKIFSGEGIYCLQPDPEVIDEELLLIPYDNMSQQEARAILVSMLNDECKERSRALRQRLIEASDFAEAGNMDECRVILEEVGLALDVDSPDDIPVLELMALLHDSPTYVAEDWFHIWRLLADREASPRVA